MQKTVFDSYLAIVHNVLCAGRRMVTHTNEDTTVRHNW